MKKYKIVFTPDAYNDIDNIYEYLAIEKGLPDIAFTYIKKLEEECRKLENVPMRGRNRNDIRDNLRVLALDKNSVAAFEVNEKKNMVIILNIFRGGMDYETILEERTHNGGKRFKTTKTLFKEGDNALDS